MLHRLTVPESCRPRVLGRSQAALRRFRLDFNKVLEGTCGAEKSQQISNKPIERA